MAATRAEKKGNFMIIPQQGEIMKYRFTGNIFEVKKITDQFVILYSLDGSMQIMTGKKNLSHSFEKILLDETIKESVPRYDCHETGPPTSGERRSPGYVRRPEENPCMGCRPQAGPG